MFNVEDFVNEINEDQVHLEPFIFIFSSFLVLGSIFILIVL